MVLLQHILDAKLSNSHSALLIIEEDNRFTGLAKYFWSRILLNSADKVSTRVLVFDFTTLQFQSLHPELLKINFENKIPKLTDSQSDIELDDRLTFIDNIEQTVFWQGEEFLTMLSTRRNRIS